MSFELSKSFLILKLKHVSIATYDVTFMVGRACEFFRRYFGWKAFVMRLLYTTFKEKLKIQRHHPFKFGFGFTSTCIMVVYENVMKSGTNSQEWGSR